MRQAVVIYLPWFLSMISIWMMIRVGDKHRNAWAIGLANQGLWTFWIFAAQAWGFFPLNIALWIIYARNHAKWSTETQHD